MNIDLRPHYVFAYYVEYMDLLSRALLYYSRRDGALHYRYEASPFRLADVGHEDMERVVPVGEEVALLLESVFRLMIETFRAGGFEPWYVLDGYECMVICGRQRIRFAGPCPPSPFAEFLDFVNRLTEHMEHLDQGRFEETLMMIPTLVSKMEKQNELKA